MSRTKYDLETVLQAVRGTGQWAKDGMVTSSGGMIATVARRLGVSRKTVYSYKSRWATVEQALQEERDEMLDFTESQLWKQVAEGNTTAIIFALKCQGKERGWVERQEVAGVKDREIEFSVKYPDDN